MTGSRDGYSFPGTVNYYLSGFLDDRRGGASIYLLEQQSVVARRG
jgi:hypothetical protein